MMIIQFGLLLNENWSIRRNDSSEYLLPKTTGFTPSQPNEVYQVQTSSRWKLKHLLEWFIRLFVAQNNAAFPNRVAGWVTDGYGKIYH